MIGAVRSGAGRMWGREGGKRCNFWGFACGRELGGGIFREKSAGSGGEGASSVHYVNLGKASAGIDVAAPDLPLFVDLFRNIHLVYRLTGRT